MFLASTIVVVTWFLVDTSEELTPDQVRVVREFALRTQSLAVILAFDEAIEDRRLTVDETKAVIEVAKKAEPGYGLF